MKEETSDAAAPAENGFRIANQPLVGTERAASPWDRQSIASVTSDDLLYVVARDPQTLFLYWDLNWTRLFARAGLSARQVHLRIYGGDGSIEGTQEINPFRGHCYAQVAGAGTEYYCELGGFEDENWTSLVRSAPATTPEASMSEDLSGDFATLPIHLSFQRLLDLLGTTELDRTQLAVSVAELQENAGGLQNGAARKTRANRNGANGNGTTGAHAAELSELVEAALHRKAPATLTAEERARWKELGQRYGGSSWSGASKGGFGGSSPA